MIVMSATAPNRYWMIRGPGIRHGHQIASRLTPGSTAAAAAHLLLRQGPTVSGHFPTAAFRTYSREPKSDGERIVPRGSIRGQTRSPSGRAMPHASVLLVKNEPVDGIFERWSDADEHGEFRFDSIPAGRYDYVFVFDNLPSRLRRSFLVARNLKVKRDTTTTPLLSYQRMQGSDRSAPPVPAPRKSAAFLTYGQITRLRRTAYRNDAIPMLAADALSGRRVRTGLIRQWLITSTARLHSTLQQDATVSTLVVEMTDLAAAYDVNRGSGLLTNTEDRDIRSALKLAAVHLVRAQELKKIRSDSTSSLALAITAGVLRSTDLAKLWREKSNEILMARLESMAIRADENPGSVEHAELCSMLAAAMTNHALGSDNYLKHKLRRVTKLATAYLTPVDRRVASTDRANTPDRTLGFLGLAKSAFADRPLGERARVLWNGCGSPVWAPRGNESIVGALLTEADSPQRTPIRPTGIEAARRPLQNVAGLRLRVARGPGIAQDREPPDGVPSRPFQQAHRLRHRDGRTPGGYGIGHSPAALAGPEEPATRPLPNHGLCGATVGPRRWASFRQHVEPAELRDLCAARRVESARKVRSVGRDAQHFLG